MTDIDVPSPVFPLSGVVKATFTWAFICYISVHYFHSHLLSFWFLVHCLLLLLVYPRVDSVLLVLDLHMKYTVEVVLRVYILSGLLLCDSSLICKNCCHVFARRYTLDDDSDHPMDIEPSLLLKGFPCECILVTQQMTKPQIALFNIHESHLVLCTFQDRIVMCVSHAWNQKQTHESISPHVQVDFIVVLPFTPPSVTALL